MVADLFAKEAAVLETAEAALAAGVAWPDDAQESFKSLTKGYSRLFRQFKRMIRMTDRSQEEIRQAGVRIEAQRQELEELYDERGRQAEALEEQVQDRTRDMKVAQEKLQMLVEMGVAMAAEQDEARLMESILLGAKDLTNADGGTLYRRDGDDLSFEIVRNDTLNIALGGTTGAPISFPAVDLVDPETGQPNHKNVASHAALVEQSVSIDDAYHDDRFDFSGTRKFDESTGYRSTSFLTVPLKPRGKEVVGVLQLINAKHPATGGVIPFDDDIISFVEALASQAAVALDNQILLTAQRKLLDSFIELIASAIDAKSPYTGGHCARVPELARLLAEEACRCDDGLFADFQLNEEEWYEFHIASWLHDCGKVTTPEYVVDKATKLETIYNRIHEIRMRFEVLIRDAEITYLTASQKGQNDPLDLARQRDERIAEIKDDFAFIATCNVGGEFMADELRDRVERIAGQTWVRHLDDRLGISDDENQRKARTPAAELPIKEPLLADKEEHIFHRTDGGNPFGSNPYEFRMDVPEHLYNLGEIYNLCIERGTLTAEDRFKINDHIMQTIIMLEQLPFPPHLARVPEIAGGHHETMEGTGYPRKLTRDEMSLPARIMAIADIFEALTASDRPYKKAKTLSESLKIMSFMRNDAHIDPDLFDLFLECGIYQDYADKFLDPSQVDEVDVSAYMRAS